MSNQSLQISVKSLLYLLALVGVLLFLYLIRDIVLLLFIAVIFMSAFNPLIDLFEELKFPRWLAILLLYIALTFFLAGFLNILIPPLINQMQEFVRNLPSIVETASRILNLSKDINEVEVRRLIQTLLQNFSSEIAATPAGIVRLGATLIDRVLSGITIFVFTFYLLLEHKKIKKNLIHLFFKDSWKEAYEKVEKVERKLGAWLRGQFILMTVVGLAVYVGLTLLQVRFALPLALIAGLLEIVPIVGPIVSAILAIIIAISISPLKAAGVALLYLLVQQLENNLLVPKIMNQAVGLDPLLVILALMIGGRLMGPLGALLAVPTTAVLMILLEDRLKKENF